MEEKLRDFLLQLNLSGYTKGKRKAGNNLLSRQIELFASYNCDKCTSEVFLGLEKKEKPGYLNYILQKGDVKYAIEVDSSNKKWGLQKLIHAKSIGYRPIWVRWCVDLKIGVPDDVYLIDLT